jgi:hypothetical protein
MQRIKDLFIFIAEEDGVEIRGRARPCITADIDDAHTLATKKWRACVVHPRIETTQMSYLLVITA